MSPDGRLIGIHSPQSTGTNTVTDATTGNFIQLNAVGNGGATTVLGNTGLVTYTAAATSATAFAVQPRSQTGTNPNNPVGDGIQMNGITFWANANRDANSLRAYGVGSRG